jgi:hypothetical protein
MAYQGEPLPWMVDEAPPAKPDPRSVAAWLASLAKHASETGSDSAADVFAAMAERLRADAVTPIPVVVKAKPKPRRTAQRAAAARQAPNDTAIPPQQHIDSAPQLAA